MIKNVMIIALTGFVLVGCTAKVRTPNATINGDGYSIDVDGRNNGYNHCPPGHAKKGWC